MFEGTDGGEDIDGDAENGGERGEEAEASARYQERVCSVSYSGRRRGGGGGRVLFHYVVVSRHFVDERWLLLSEVTQG